MNENKKNFKSRSSLKRSKEIGRRSGQIDISEFYNELIPNLAKKPDNTNNTDRRCSLDQKKNKNSNNNNNLNNKKLDNKNNNNNNDQQPKIPEIFLDSVKYDDYLNSKNNKNIIQNFCEAFFIASFPLKDGKVIENSQTLPSECKHKICSSLPAMKPEIIKRYPLEDNKNLELNNLAATLCFPNGIKVCYSEKDPTAITNYFTPITNQKGERLFMMTYHYYKKISNDVYTKKYEMNPLKHHLRVFGDSYLTLREEEFTPELTKKIEGNLQICQELGFRDFVYVPFCLCIISKYPYFTEMEKSLQSIFSYILNDKNDFEINDLILYLLHSIPIPNDEQYLNFYLPFIQKNITLKCLTIDGLNSMNINFCQLINLFDIENVIIIFRMLLSEKKILFIDNDYNRLSEITNAFISLLYPFKWMHTYIPIMSEQMLKYLATFLPFVNGINKSLMPLVKQTIEEDEDESEDKEEIFLVYIKDNLIDLSSNLIERKIKVPKYIETNVLALPYNIEKNLRKQLTEIKESYDSSFKSLKSRIYNRVSYTVTDKEPAYFNSKIREVFINMFVDMFSEYPEYMYMLEKDIIFNKNLFLEKINKEDQNFYNSFTDTQLFQYFTQNIFSEENRYFNKQINSRKVVSKANKDNSNNRISYYISPEFLGINEKDKNKIENILLQKYPTNSKNLDVYGITSTSNRIVLDNFEIDDNKYNNSNCYIHEIPPKEDKEKNKQKEDASFFIIKNLVGESLKNINNGAALKKTATVNINNIDELDEKEIDIIKENIKDLVSKIFLSEKIDYKDTKIKTDILHDINNKYGRDFFVNLVTQNIKQKKIIILKNEACEFLAFLIYHTLIEILKLEETDKILTQIILLIQSTIFYGVEKGDGIITIFEIKKNLFQSYPKLSQKNFWQKWFDVELEKERSKVKDGKIDEIMQQNILLKICSEMIKFELQKTFIKNTLDDINSRIFGKESDLSEETKELYRTKIISARYISKIKN